MSTFRPHVRPDLHLAHSNFVWLRTVLHCPSVKAHSSRDGLFVRGCTSWIEILRLIFETLWGQSCTIGFKFYRKVLLIWATSDFQFADLVFIHTFDSNITDLISNSYILFRFYWFDFELTDLVSKWHICFRIHKFGLSSLEDWPCWAYVHTFNKDSAGVQCKNARFKHQAVAEYLASALLTELYCAQRRNASLHSSTCRTHTKHRHSWSRRPACTSHRQLREISC